MFANKASMARPTAQTIILSIIGCLFFLNLAEAYAEFLDDLPFPTIATVCTTLRNINFQVFLAVAALPVAGYLARNEKRRLLFTITRLQQDLEAHNKSLSAAETLVASLQVTAKQLQCKYVTDHNELDALKAQVHSGRCTNGTCSKVSAGGIVTHSCCSKIRTANRENSVLRATVRQLKKVQQLSDKTKSVQEAVTYLIENPEHTLSVFVTQPVISDLRGKLRIAQSELRSQETHENFPKGYTSSLFNCNVQLRKEVSSMKQILKKGTTQLNKLQTQLAHAEAVQAEATRGLEDAGNHLAALAKRNEEIVRERDTFEGEKNVLTKKAKADRLEIIRLTAKIEGMDVMAAEQEADAKKDALLLGAAESRIKELQCEVYDLEASQLPNDEDATAQIEALQKDITNKDDAIQNLQLQLEERVANEQNALVRFAPAQEEPVAVKDSQDDTETEPSPSQGRMSAEQRKNFDAGIALGRARGFGEDTWTKLKEVEKINKALSGILQVDDETLAATTLYKLLPKFYDDLSASGVVDEQSLNASLALVVSSEQAQQVAELQSCVQSLEMQLHKAQELVACHQSEAEKSSTARKEAVSSYQSLVSEVSQILEAICAELGFVQWPELPKVIEALQGQKRINSELEDQNNNLFTQLQNKQAELESRLVEVREVHMTEMANIRGTHAQEMATNDQEVARLSNQQKKQENRIEELQKDNRTLRKAKNAASSNGPTTPQRGTPGSAAGGEALRGSISDIANSITSSVAPKTNGQSSRDAQRVLDNITSKLARGGTIQLGGRTPNVEWMVEAYMNEVHQTGLFLADTRNLLFKDTERKQRENKSLQEIYAELKLVKSANDDARATVGILQRRNRWNHETLEHFATELCSTTEASAEPKNTAKLQQMAQ